ncbi:hypothetical protein BV898_03738 [Hypsibius exemplaris]|uniref:RING-type E3 ubiquitin transferase n=1 Tax=Hypsibius exemplaris TaxID=2072580 RepID=A0A1W0X428_HYPEX|nr:hypothetical protein BV898_03738 [Hypsibius exemplaris]
MGLANTKTNFDRGQIIEAITSEDPSVRRNVSRMLNPNMVLDTALGLKPIHVAILADNVDAVKRLLANNLTDVNCRVQGQPCLLLAAYSSNVEVVKELLKRKDLDVNAVAGDKKVTALMAAVFDGKADRPHALRAEIVEVLLRDPRCDFQITDADNYTALTYAAHIGNAVVARQLLRNGRAARYSIDELIGDIGVAVGTGHEPVCDIIVEAMTTEQKLLLAKKISSMKQAAAQRANVEGISALLDQAHALLDGSAPATKTHVDAEGAEIAVGDIIKIAVGADRIKALQAGHGGWPDELSKVLLQKTVPAIIRKFDSDGDVVADFHYIMTDESEMKLTLNPKAVKLISKATSYTAIDGNGNVIRRGDTVEILDNEEIVKPLMGRYWNDQLKPMLGKPGRIMFFDLDGDVHVKVAQQGAYYVPKVLTLVRSVKTGDGMRG